MREIEHWRKTRRETTQKETGIYPGDRILTQAEQVGADREVEMDRLPESFDANCDLQTAGGGWRFMIDVSTIDGPDPIA